MERSEILYRDWIVKQIHYGIDDINYYIRTICYDVNQRQLSKEELFFNKFNISHNQTIIATYDKIDISQYETSQYEVKKRFKNQVLTNIQYDDKIYKVKMFSTALQISDVKINPVELINFVSKKFNLKILTIKTSLINGCGQLMTFSRQDITHPNAIQEIHHTKLNINQSTVMIYNSKKFIISCKSPQQLIKSYTDLYIQSDLKRSLLLLFNLTSSWFFTLPLELYDVILNNLI